MISAGQTPGRTLHWEGKEFLFFSGYAYLGMGHSSAFTEWINQGLDLYGPVFPSSRIGNVRLQIFEELEASISRQLDLADTVSFSSGFLAGQAAIEYLHQKGPVIYAPAIHPALRRNTCSLHFREWSQWVEETIQTINSHPQFHYQVIMESVDPLRGVIHDFAWLTRIVSKTTILIDDSHGIGILGEGGSGIIQHLPKNENLDFMVCFSLAKAFGIQGGAIAANQDHTNAIRSSPHFTAGTSISPAFAYAFLHAREIYLNRRKILLQNIHYFIDHHPFHLKLMSEKLLPIFPVEDMNFHSFCLSKNIILSSFAYPDPGGKIMTRIILNSLHTTDDIDALVNSIREFKLIQG